MFVSKKKNVFSAEVSHISNIWQTIKEKGGIVGDGYNTRCIISSFCWRPLNGFSACTNDAKKKVIG